jgi:hypothetical protein
MHTLFASFQAQLQLVFGCVQDLKRAGKTKTVPTRSVIQAEDEAYTDESGDE